MRSDERGDATLTSGAPAPELILEILREGIWTIDAAEITTFVNEHMASMLGYAPSEMRGVHLFTFMDDEGRALTESRLARRRRGIREVHEHKLLRRDGTPVWTSMSVSSITGPYGEYQGAIALVTDITEQRRVESELRASTTRFQQLFASTKDAMAFFDVETLQILDANQAALDMYGYSRDELMRLTTLDVSAEPDKTRALADQAVPGASRRIPLRWHRRCDGTRFPVEITVGAFELDHRLVGFGIVRDVGARFEAAEALRRERDHSRALIGAVQDGLVETDLDGTVTEVNDEFCTMTGFAREGLIGCRAPYRYWPAELRASYMEGTADVWSGGEGSWDTTLCRADGETFPALVTASGIRGPDGRTSGYLGVIRDRTERRRAQAALRDAELERHRNKAELERQRLEVQLAHAQRLESLGRLAGGIAHDFNNQLGVILNYAGFVADHLDPESPVADDVAKIRHAAERAAELTRQLLVFGRRETAHPVVFDLGALASETVRLVRRPFGERIDLTLDLSSEVRHVDVDRGQMEQVLMNLLLNARDALTNGGTITVATATCEVSTGEVGELAPGRYAVLTVTDDGTGMTPEAAARAFEPFFTTKPRGSGSGLGLATAHGVVTGAGGHIEIESQIGVGACVRVHLPLVGVDIPDAPSPEQGTAILVVDDEPEVRAMTSRILRDAGYRVIEAGSGAEALAHAGALGADVLLTDVIMPETSGSELADRLLELRPELKVLYMSGYADEALPPSLHAALITKPFDPSALLHAVHHVLDEEAMAAR